MKRRVMCARQLRCSKVWIIPTAHPQTGRWMLDQSLTTPPMFTLTLLRMIIRISLFLSWSQWLPAAPNPARLSGSSLIRRQLIPLIRSYRILLPPYSCRVEQCVEYSPWMAGRYVRSPNGGITASEVGMCELLLNCIALTNNYQMWNMLLQNVIKHAQLWDW